MFDYFKKMKKETYQEYDKRMYDVASKNSTYTMRNGEVKPYSDFARAKAAGIVQARKDERRQVAYNKAKAEGTPWISSADYKKNNTVNKIENKPNNMTTQKKKTVANKGKKG